MNVLEMGDFEFVKTKRCSVLTTTDLMRFLLVRSESQTTQHEINLPLLGIIGGTLVVRNKNSQFRQKLFLFLSKYFKQPQLSSALSLSDV